jgi:hypothetical protein
MRSGEWKRKCNGRRWFRLHTAYLMLARDRLDDALLSAACDGDLGGVCSLLLDGHADPCARLNGPIIYAAFHGHTDVVAALLADGRANPAARHSAALHAAASAGHHDVVEPLLADGRADPAAMGSNALLCGVRHGHSRVVAALLADGRADPRVAVVDASFYGRVGRVVAPNQYVTLLAALLADERVDATSSFVAALAVAEYAGDPVAQCVQRWLRWLRRRTWLRVGLGGA